MRLAPGLLLIAATAGACGGASPESGVTAYLQLANAQFVPGSLSPDAGALGPDGGALGPAHSRVEPLGDERLPRDPERSALG